MEEPVSQRSALPYYGLAVLLVLVWGSTFVSTKVLLEYLHPVAIMFLRCIIAWCVLFLIHPKFHKPTRLGDELIYLGCGISGFTVYFLTENYGLSFANASTVSLLVSLAPVFTILTLRFLDHSHTITPLQLVGFAVSFSGVFLVVGSESGGSATRPVLGGVLAVLSALSWAFYSLFLKKIKSPYPQIYTTRKIFFYAIVTILPCLLLTPNAMPHFPVHAAVKVYGNLLFLGIAASAVGYVCWNICVVKLGTARTSNLIYFIPLVTVLLSVPILQEPLTLHTIFGAALILSGVVLSEKGNRELSV